MNNRLLRQSPISSKIEKQITVLCTSVEAEYRPMTITCCKITWLKQLLEELMIEHILPIILDCDDQAPFHIASDLVFMNEQNILRLTIIWFIRNFKLCILLNNLLIFLLRLLVQTSFIIYLASWVLWIYTFEGGVKKDYVKTIHYHLDYIKSNYIISF